MARGLGAFESDGGRAELSILGQAGFMQVSCSFHAGTFRGDAGTDAKAIAPANGGVRSGAAEKRRGRGGNRRLAVWWISYGFGMDLVLQSHLPFAPWADPRTRRLPGTQPMEPGDWLRVDDAFAGQMALRAALIAQRHAQVHALDGGAVPAAVELLDRVLGELPGLGYRVGSDAVLRPDGVEVWIDRAAPLITLGHLCQNDFCLMEKRGAEHVLTGAILCFPASWTLAEKFLRPMAGIHAPVAVYDGDLARRVQRLFDAIRVEQPLWRANALHYEDAELFHPRSEAEPRRKPQGLGGFIRSERQGFVRLPVSGAVVFSIHTYLVRDESLTPAQVAALAAHPIHRAGG